MKTRQSLLILVAFAAVALWAGDALILSPLTKAWKARSARLVELRKSVTQGRTLLERDRVIRDRWETMRTNTLPGEISVAENRVLKAFDRWSQDSRISITSIKPQWKRAEDDYSALECRVDAAGTLSTLTRFLYEIEKDPLALKVSSVEITARDNDGQQLTLGLQVSGLLLNSNEP